MLYHPMLVKLRKEVEEEKLAKARNNDMARESGDDIPDGASSKRKRENTPQTQEDAELNVKKVRRPNNRGSDTPAWSDNDKFEENLRPQHAQSAGSEPVSRQGTRRFPLDTVPDYSVASLIPPHAATAPEEEQATSPSIQFPTNPINVRFNMHSLNLQAKRLGIAATADLIGEIGMDGKLRLKNYYNKNGTIADVSIPKFDCLPDSILSKIYRLIFVREEEVSLTGLTELWRTAALLRVCRRFHEGGTAVLYGENTFHLARRHAKRGSYWENPWKEIGFKDVHQFIVDIGPRNIKQIKYLSMYLEDAAPSLTPTLNDAGRRFVNDVGLHEILKAIGSNAVLERFALAINNRKGIDSHDAAFVQHLSSIKCHELKIAIIGSRSNRLAPGLENQLRASMEVPRPSDVDVSKKKVPKMTF